MASNTFEANPESLYDFASKNGRGLYIPAYQRAYAWNNENVERLFNDLIQGLTTSIKKSEDTVTFLGTIIALEDKNKKTIQPLLKRQVYGEVISIIDGQQRLTTLLIFCVALLVNIEIKWSNLLKVSNKEDNTLEINEWIQQSVNNLRGELQGIIFEEQKNGKEEYRFFPKMIRSFIDRWSYEAENAIYNSPIAWLIFEYIKFNESKSDKWKDFLTILREANKISGDEVNYIYKIFQTIYKYLEQLNTKDYEEITFPNFSDWLAHPNSQEYFFEEKFPDELIDLISQEKLEEGTENTKYLHSLLEIISTLAFAKFLIRKITLVIVTATNEDFAFDVFEALNSTGQPLTAIETFTPTIVQYVGIENYEKSSHKLMLDTVSNYLNKEKSQSKKQKNSAELLITFALTETGETIRKNLSDQRAFMRGAFSDCQSSENKDMFLNNLASVSNFYKDTWVTETPTFPGTVLKLDDLSELCLGFLIALKHTITIPLLSRYAGIISKDITDTEVIENFKEVLKATAAFAALWRSTRLTTDRVDSIFRELLSKGDTNIDLSPLARRETANELPHPSKIKKYFLRKLEIVGEIPTKTDWINKSLTMPMYSYNETLTRFILLVAFNDLVQDSTNKYKLIVGKESTFPTLTGKKWYDKNFATIEHIAPTKPDSNSTWLQTNIYEDENKIHTIGNLTLIPHSPNSSISNRDWIIKKKLYEALSAETRDIATTIIKELKDNYNISLNEDIYSGNYLAHINVISQYPQPWSSEAIDERGRELLTYAADTLYSWLE